MSTSVEALPRVTLKPRRALPFFSRHPWVFAGAIARTDSDLEPGREVAVVSHEGEFIARGLFNPDSNIRVRLYSWRADTPLDADFWSARIDEAVELRRRLGYGDCRLVFSEGDGLSGLTLDRYGEWLLMQITSRALYERRDLLVDLLQTKLSPRGIWLRTEKGIREAEGLAQSDGPVIGDPPQPPLFVTEHGVRFGVDVVAGQKTGFYYDQRDNRAAVARYCEGLRVLDLYCYTGGFGVTAAKVGGAAAVLGVDSSAPAVTLANENAALNEVADRVRFQQGDVQQTLQELSGAGERFDVVITDPPKFARHRKGIDQALRAYQKLNAGALSVLAPGGILASCSCSGLVTREQFHAALHQASIEANCSLQILEDRGQAADHPVSIDCPQSAYLKCVICRVVAVR
jgi:23S rRNA (cytosine1962-C5)-methyltransferase